MTASRLRLALVGGGAGVVLAVLLATRPHVDGPVTAWNGEQVALVTAWIGALGCSAWIAVVAIASNIALGVGRPRLAAVFVRSTPAFVRRFAGIAIVGSSLVATAVPASAVPSPATRPVVVAVADEPVVRTPAPAHPQRPPTVPPRAPIPRPASPVPARAHVVVPGDNLWRIARAALVARGTPEPNDPAIVDYWHSVIAANTSTLRSGDPNLIYAGETITLPEPQ